MLQCSPADQSRKTDLFSFSQPKAFFHLTMRRSSSLQRNTAKSRAAYLGFLTIWKDADPDIPILKEAKAEYAKLQ
jgi:hypothetical protein